MRMNDAGKIVERVWSELPVHFSNIKLDEVVVMPNHMHGIIMIMESIHGKGSIRGVGATSGRPFKEDHPSKEGDPRSPQRPRLVTLGSIMGYFKHQTAKNINILHKMKGRSVWQRDYYDHIIFSGRDHAMIRAYIANNPSQWASDDENPLRNI